VHGWRIASRELDGESNKCIFFVERLVLIVTKSGTHIQQFEFAEWVGCVD